MNVTERKLQTPVIVTFANQKGGVGKTTLCATFANFLVTMGVRVLVIDCDFQHSIVKRREVDIRKYGEQNLPYEVVGHDANDRDAVVSLMDKLRNDPSIDVALMDSPGSLKASGLTTMFANSDYLVIPFHYDVTTIPSTATFLMFINRLQEFVRDMDTRLIMVPNMNDGRVGKKVELTLWEKTRETFARYGMVTEKIPKRADMERISTMACLDMQASIVKPVFTTIYREIFGTDEPYRPVVLSGIQLTKNLKTPEKEEVREEPVEADAGSLKPESKPMQKSLSEMSGNEPEVKEEKEVNTTTSEKPNTTGP